MVLQYFLRQIRQTPSMNPYRRRKYDEKYPPLHSDCQGTDIVNSNREHSPTRDTKDRFENIRHWGSQNVVHAIPKYFQLIYIATAQHNATL